MTDHWDAMECIVEAILMLEEDYPSVPEIEELLPAIIGIMMVAEC